MPRAINLLRSARAIVRQLPDKVEITFYARTGGDTFASSGTVFRARKRPQQSAHVTGIGYTVADWMIFADDGQEETVKPSRLGKFTDPDGAEWHIEGTVERVFGDLVYRCRGCVKKLASP